eukprot:8126625-Pyramimonas_sp.AAC.1
MARLNRSRVSRAARGTRPLGLNNTANKIVGATINRAVTPAIQKIGAPSQRGFIAGRNFVNNIVDLDSSACLASLNAVVSSPLAPPFFRSAMPGRFR